jgi:hypothetical protein
MKKRQITIHLSESTNSRIRKHCEENGIQYSAFAEKALSEYFDKKDDAGLILKKIDRQTYLLRQIQAIVQLLFEAFGLWLRYYFLHTADIPEDGKLAAWTDGNLKYSKFMDYLKRHIEDKHRWMDEFIQPLFDANNFKNNDLDKNG